MASGQWALNRNLGLHWADGFLVARIGRAEPTPVEPDLIPLLEQFAAPCDLDDGVLGFLERFAGYEERPDLVARVWATVREFQEASLLVAVEGHQSVRTSFELAGPHVLMLSDHARTLSYRDVIGRHAPGATVLEIGCGSGILSCFAALAGARHVYAIEHSAIVDVAREIFQINGLADRITLIAGSSLTVELPEPVDVVVSELMGSDPLDESVHQILRDAQRRLMRPGGRMIPLDLSIRAMGIYTPQFVRSAYSFEQKRRTAAGLGEAYGLNLSPLIAAYGAEQEQRERLLTYETILGGFVDVVPSEFSEVLLTEEVQVLELVLGEDDLPPVTEVDLTTKVIRDGNLNGVITYFTSQLDERCTITTSPHAPQPLKNWRQIVTSVEPRPVHAGEVVQLGATVDLRVNPNVTYTRRS